MLKISRTESLPRGGILRLEGQVKGPWVDEVRDSFERLVAEGRELTVDLSQVSFVDEVGIALFAKLRSRHVGFAAPSPFVRELLGI